MEDLLQSDVKQCLNDYKRAGIQTWMLTGDKGKTAKMIGLQCGMFSTAKLKLAEQKWLDMNEDVTNHRF